MEKIAGFAFLFSIVAVFSARAQTFAEDSAQPDDWRSSLGLGKEKLTRLHFYFHDTISGKNPSAVQVAQAPITDKSPTLFGKVLMADDPLTVGPEATSKEVGRAQGLYGSAGMEELSLLMALNFCFTDGKYNGSSIAMLSRNPVTNPGTREMAIVGGTGLFRLARGIAQAKTYWFNNIGDAIVEYHVTVLHY